MNADRMRWFVPHDHSTFEPWCFRCDLGRDELEQATGDPNEIRNVPQDDPFNPPPATTENQA